MTYLPGVADPHLYVTTSGDDPEPVAEPPLPGPPESDASASPPPRLAKNGTFIAVAAGLVVTAVAGIVLLVNFLGKSDEEQIQQVVVKFAAAVDTVDQARIAGLLCQEEAAVFTDSDGYDPANNGGVAAPENRLRSATASDIPIVGAVASARVTRLATYSTTLYFRKENGDWKVCAPAADQFSINVGNH